MWLDITVVHGSNLRWIIVITMRSGIMAAAGTKKFDFILRGGHVVDPAAGRDGLFDVGIRGGKVASVQKGLKGAKRVIDVSGGYVLPGFIDTHAHVYRYVTGRFGLEADWIGTRSGVATLVDQGGPSAMTIAGFRKFIVEPAKSRVVSFISAYLVGGMEGHLYPSLHGPEQINVKHTVKAAIANRDIVKGIKVHAEIGGASRWGVETMKLAKEISRDAGLPIYVHLGQMWTTKGKRKINPDTVIGQAVDLMEEGDILAHPFTRHPGGFISAETGEVHPAVRKAIDRGVRVDVGHGSHFSFGMARLALGQGIIPNTLGADLHGYNIAVPVEGSHNESFWKNPFADLAPFSLPIAMTELMMLGLSFSSVVAMVTCNAAEMIGMSGELGTLARGRVAEITVVDRVQGAWELHDNSRTIETADEIIVPRFVFKDGVQHLPDSPLLPAPIEMRRKSA